MKFNGLLCIVCSLICAVFIGSSDAAATGWTEPAITGATGSGNYTVAESAATTVVVATLQCTVGGTATYAIETPATGAKFDVDSASGELTPNTALDYADNPYVLEVTCTDDGGGDVGTATITINVNDQPVFSTTQYVGTIPDGSTAGATATVTVSVTDQNTADTQTYSINSGDSGGHWTFDGNKLKVATDQTIAKATLAEYFLVIKSNDGAQDSSNTAMVWIAVTTCSGIKAAVASGLAMIITVALSKLL